MRRRRAVELALLISILLLAGWTRVANFRAALVGGELIPQVDGDSSYHLHRSLETLRAFPRVPHRDPEMDWPRGAFVPWADGFDLGAASFALLAGGRTDPARARLAIALWPVLLGVLLVLAVIRLCGTLLPGARGKGAALASGLAVAAMPGSVASSAFGRMDHHVFEMLVMVLLATWALRGWPARSLDAPPPALRFELEGALLCGLGIYGFTGTPLYVAVATVPLALSAWKRGRLRGSGATGLALGAVLGAALSVPAILDHHQALTFKLPSLLQPALVALAGAAVAACAWMGGGDGARRRRRARWFIAVTLAGLAACAPFLPLLAREVSAGTVGWLLHRDPWLAQIWEFAPYLQRIPGSASPWLRISVEFAWPGYLLPFAAALVVWGIRGPRARLALYFTVSLVSLTLVQNRFSRVLAPFAAVLIGLSIGLGVRFLAGRWRRSWSVWATPLVTAVLLFLDPSPRASLRPSPPPRRVEAIYEAAFDLRDRPPATGERTGALSSWSFGHQLQALGGVPVVVNGFGSYLDAKEFWKTSAVFRGSAAALDDYLEEHRIGVVVAGAATLPYESAPDDPAGFVGGRLNEAYMRKRPLSPLLIAGSAVPAWDVPHLEHLLPRFASRARVADVDFSLPFLWTYEVVPGARLHGRSTPGARIHAELPFAEQGRPHVYQAWGRAGADGRWVLVLPFPSQYRTATVSAPGDWAIGLEGSTPVAVRVPLEAVRRGGTIEVVLPAASAAAREAIRSTSGPVVR